MAEKIKTVSMVRDEPMHPGGPTEADVHPDEVENWKQGGWALSAAETVDEPQPYADLSLDELKAKARELGIAFHPHIGAEKLAAKIAEAENDQ